jgi:transcriptional regulator with XRE-family HTH domain
MAIFRTLRTYRFLDKDPVVDELRTLVGDRGLDKQLGHLAELAGVARSTVHNLFNGETKKPQNRTVMGIATSIGYRREWVSTEFDLDTELKAARAWNVKERKRVEELREKAGNPRKRKKR